ncbi:TPA: hypothetical protein U0J99_000138 [Streptococcus suis]|nr:hypothetical protein [Streptococcus suis]
MTYKTTKAIRDLQDDEFCYYSGAIYPRPGLVVSQERLDELVEKGHIVKIDDEPSLPAKEEEKPVVDDPTVDEIKAALDELGIKYSSRAKKADLLELLKGA